MTTLEAVREKIKANSPKDEFALQFKRLSDDCIVSLDGQWYVGRVRINAAEMFEVWFKATDSKSALQLRVNLPNGAEAKKWASSLASAYLKGHISLKGPLSPDELQKFKELAP